MIRCQKKGRLQTPDSARPDFSSLYGEAIEAGRRRDYRRAADLFAQVAGATDEFPLALLYLGRSCHALGEHGRAIRALTAFVRRRPGSAAGRLFLGRAHLAVGDLEAAVRELAAAVKARPDLAPAHGLLGLACLRARRFDEALAAFTEARRLAPDDRRLEVGYLNTALVAAVRCFHRNRLVDSARLFSEVLDRRGSSMLPHVYLARIFRELGKDGMALFHLDAACSLSPGDSSLQLQRAMVLLALGREPEAFEALKIGSYFLKAGKGAGRSPQEVQRFLAVELFQQGRFRDAVFHATRLLRADGKDPMLHALVAESYRALGELEKARNHYLRALEGDREAMAPRYGLLAVLWEQGRHGDLAAEARRVLRRDDADSTARYFESLALSKVAPADPGTLGALQGQVRDRGADPVVMAALAESYESAGLADLAEGWYSRTLKVVPGETSALRGLGRLYAKAGRTEDLGSVYRRLLEAKPDDRKARRGLVRALVELGRWAEAAPEIERLIASGAKGERLRTTLVHCYRRSGRHADALLVLRELLVERPDAEELVKAALYCLDRLGARENALRLAERFQKDHGERHDLTLMSGVLWYRAGKLEKAASAFRSAIALAPKDWRAYRNLGMVYRKTGVKEFAEKFLATGRRLKKSAETVRPS
ncbi:MAG: tetratricopeptide repeat protein [Spirochaetes bacterium]|nr:tetratricopeptide repeat protein [Spirochaetota bacterium]